MHPPAITIAVVASIGLTSIAVSLPAHAQGALRPLDARIVNTPAQPVPVADAALAAAVGRLGAAPTPYQHAVRFGQDSAACTQFVCVVTFPAVPAGKRLVVSYASARYTAPAVNTFASVELRDTQNGDGLVLPTTAASTTFPTTSYIASGAVTYYVEAGRSPMLMLGGIGVGSLPNTALASVVGHLVDAP